MATTLGSKVANVSPYMTNVGQLIAPASNVNGVIIRTASINASASIAILSTGTKAPANYFDLTVPVILSVRTNDGKAEILPYEIQIPAGYGVWFVQSGSATCTANVTYDLL